MGKKYTHLTLDERHEIYRLLAGGRSRRSIAEAIGRDVSCISRELRRNCSEKQGSYLPDSADSLSRIRRHKSGTKIERSKQLQQNIEEHLAMGWSPEVIAGRLEQELGKQIISHESIYKYIYDTAKEKELHRYLVRRKRKRGQRFSQKINTTKIPGRICIHQRPESYNDEFGHWEGDTVHFAGHKEVILTIYEKSTKLTLGAKMHTRTAEETIDNMKTIFAKIPAEARRSVTFDNGLEFSEHQQLKGSVNMETYFCDPYSSWQKGGVENANGILRRFILKGTRADDCSAKQVQTYLKRMNSTPRKSLGYMTPYESFLQKTNKQTKMLTLISSTVALQN
jgi:IS30 family transposase